MSTEQKDTITVELPIEARGDYVRIVGLTNLSRDYWRALAADPSTALLEVNAHIAPAVVAWIERDEWEPLPIPDVGRTIKATIRDGRVETFKVGGIDVTHAWAYVWEADPRGEVRCIQRVHDARLNDSNDIVAWEYVDEPAPAVTAEQAWDEGYAAGKYDAEQEAWMVDYDPGTENANNPYRQEGESND